MSVLYIMYLSVYFPYRETALDARFGAGVKE